MRNIFIYIVFSLVVLTSSCTTDFEVNAPYKELTTVYGLLDQSKPAQYIRINKSFLGEGDALQMAKFQDSINYKAGELDVRMERYVKGVLQPNSTEVLERIAITKETGDFSSDSNFVYKADNPLFTDSEYKLVIFNKRTNQTISATTPLITDVTITRPLPNPDPAVCPNPTFSCATQLNFKKSGTGYAPLNVEWTPGKNAKLFELVLRIFYTERDPQNTNIILKQDSLDWVITQISTSSTSSQKYEINGEDFYKFIQNKIPVSSSVKRFAIDVRVDFFINTGGEELDTYIDVSRPSTGVVQEKPEYTNVSNGIGVFSCRYTARLSNKALDTKSSDELKDGPYTSSLFD